MQNHGDFKLRVCGRDSNPSPNFRIITISTCFPSFKEFKKFQENHLFERI